MCHERFCQQKSHLVEKGEHDFSKAAFVRWCRQIHLYSCEFFHALLPKIIRTEASMQNMSSVFRLNSLKICWLDKSIILEGKDS